MRCVCVPYAYNQNPMGQQIGNKIRILANANGLGFEQKTVQQLMLCWYIWTLKRQSHEKVG
jgi:hypothetical protein